MTREEEIYKLLQGVFHKERDHLTGHTVVLFGSRARKTAKPRADFDVGVVGKEPLPLKDFYYLADQLENLPTLYRIDWVDLARVDETFRRAALADSVVIYESEGAH